MYTNDQGKKPPRIWGLLRWGSLFLVMTSMAIILWPAALSLLGGQSEIGLLGALLIATPPLLVSLLVYLRLRIDPAPMRRRDTAAVSAVIFMLAEICSGAALGYILWAYLIP